jgi:hypothetical protein
MGGSCGTYRGEEICIQKLGGENVEEGDLFQDPGVDGSIILKWLLQK